MSNPPSQRPSKPDPNPLKPKTMAGKRTLKILMSLAESLDIVGRGLFGSLWKTVYLSIQDAIALSTLLQLPSLVGRVIIGKDFSSLNICLQENALGVSRYACFIIIISDFCLWIILAGRIVGRFWIDLGELRRGHRHGSNKP